MKKKTKKNPKGAGRTYKYGEETRPVVFRLPVSKIKEIRSKIERILKDYEV